jgi:probable F420-dependent oxidoreductase
MAELVEQSDLDGVWLSDHVVLMSGSTSKYPFSEDGSFFLEPDSDWLEWLTAAAYLAAATERVELGVGVCVLPLRHPLLLAKQVATLDQLSHGRVRLGVGAGWLAEEFVALSAQFESRGRAVDGALALLRAAWTGSPPAGEYGPWLVPDGVNCQPTPLQAPLPIYVGGSSSAALRRVVEYGHGWYGTASGGDVPPGQVRQVRRKIEDHCERIGRNPDEIELALRVAIPRRQFETGELVERLRGYVAAGVRRLSFDIAWEDEPTVMARRLALLGQAVQVAAEASAAGL